MLTIPDRILIGLLDAAMILGVIGTVRGIFVFRKQIERYREAARRDFRG
jgi:hypothetical protein